MNFRDDHRLMRRLKRLFERLDSAGTLRRQPRPQSPREWGLLIQARLRTGKALDLAAVDLAEALTEWWGLKHGVEVVDTTGEQHSCHGSAEAACAPETAAV